MYPHPPEGSRRKNIPVDDRRARKGPSKHPNKKKEDVSSLSPLKSAPDLIRKGNQNLATCGSTNKISSGRDGNFGIIRANNEYHLERSQSFSKYKPLPAINDQHDEEDDKMSNKRTFGSWSEDQHPDLNQEKDDHLLDTIKKMRLGSDTFDDVCNYQNVSTTKRMVNLNQGKETCQEDDNIMPCTSSIDLVIRLPDGKRVQNSFSSSDTVGSVVEYLSKRMKKKIDLKGYVLFINEVPKRELKNRKSTLVGLGIHDKSVLVLDTRDSPSKKY